MNVPRLGLCLIPLLTISACAPLHPHASTWGDVGEVAGRVLVCPFTLCTSELILQMEHQANQDRAAYTQWYRSLPPEHQDREDRRESVRMLALGLALSGGVPFQQGQMVAPVVPITTRPLTCTSQTIGTQTYFNCP